MRRATAALALAGLALLLAAGGAGGQEGPAPAHELRFQGNQALGEGELREAASYELQALEERGLRRPDADDAAFQMELAYRRAGFAFSEVTYELDETGAAPVVTFRVTEGPRVRLGEVRLRGNEAFSDETLGAFLAPQEAALLGVAGPRYYVASELEGAAGTLRDYYARSGYLDVRVSPPAAEFSPDRTRAAITVEIDEGPRYVVRELRFRGEVLPEAAEALERLRERLVGEPYFPRRRLEVKTGLTEVYGNLSHPDASVAVERVAGPEPGDVILEARVDAGPRVRVVEVEVVGNEQTRARFIRNRVRLEPGEPYTLEARRRSFQELYRSGLFSRVDLSLQPTDAEGERILRVEVEELPSQELYLEPGWGSYEYLRLRAGFREKNLLGTGRIGRVEGGVSFRSEDLSVGLTDPWFLNTDLTADFPLYYRRRQEPSFTHEEKGGSLTLSRRLSPRLTATLTYDYRITSLTDVQVDAEAEDLDTGYDLASLKLQATHDTRTDLFFPRGGQRTFLAGEVAETYLGSELTFLRFTGGTRWFFGLTPDTVLGVRYDAGLVLPTGDTVSLPLAERFFNGGESSVRSFRESELGPEDASGEPVGGYGFNVASVELRRRLWGNLAGTLFLDYGNVSPNESRSEQNAAPYQDKSELISDTLDDFFRSFRPAVGAGLQYLLPVGPARLDAAWNPEHREGERSFAVHFSVGMAF